MSVWAFLAMGFDKRQAKKEEITYTGKESLGSRDSWRWNWSLYWDANVSRHKTRKTSFRVGFLMLTLAYGIIILYLFGVAMPAISAV